MNLLQLQRNVHDNFLKIQRIYRYIKLPKFEEAYEEATEEEKVLVKSYIEKGEENALILWTRRMLHAERQYDMYTVGELRELAKKLKIPNSSIMTRDGLLSEISKRQE